MTTFALGDVLHAKRYRRLATERAAFVAANYNTHVMNAVETVECVGIDLSLIEESLRLTPEQRTLQHQTALEMALQSEAAFQNSTSKREDDGTQSTLAASVRG